MIIKLGDIYSPHTSLTDCWILFTHGKLFIASASHNLKWWFNIVYFGKQGHLSRRHIRTMKVGGSRPYPGGSLHWHARVNSPSVLFEISPPVVVMSSSGKVYTLLQNVSLPMLSKRLYAYTNNFVCLYNHWKCTVLKSRLVWNGSIYHPFSMCYNFVFHLTVEFLTQFPVSN